MKKAEKLARQCARMKEHWQGRRRGGRPRRQIDPTALFNLAWEGLSDSEIAKQLGCDPRTLRRHCGDLVSKYRAQWALADSQRQALLAPLPLPPPPISLQEALAREWFAEQKQEIAAALARVLHYWGKTPIRIAWLCRAALSLHCPEAVVDLKEPAWVRRQFWRARRDFLERCLVFLSLCRVPERAANPNGCSKLPARFLQGERKTTG